MKDLKCGLTDCSFNKGYSCCGNHITVNSNTDCSSFTKREQDNFFEAGVDIASGNCTVDTYVECKANCLYNKNDRCVANGITVMDEDGKGATCLTYIRA